MKFDSCSMVDTEKHKNKECVYLCESPYEEGFSLIAVLDAPNKTIIMDAVPSETVSLSKDQHSSHREERIESMKQIMVAIKKRFSH